jgi:hypothetical protein
MIPSTDCEFSRPTAALAILTSTQNSLLDRIFPKPEIPDRCTITPEVCWALIFESGLTQIQIHASTSLKNCALLNMPRCEPLMVHRFEKPVKAIASQYCSQNLLANGRRAASSGIVR